jgi:tryptophan synthase alpha chain
MTNRIDAKFRDLREASRKGFIAYITAGDPEPSLTLPLALELERSGADIVELGVPFSDPLADGVVNQRAAERALRHGVTLKTILGTVAAIRRRSEIPIVLFTYLNPVFSYGFDRFARDAARSGVDGVLSLDLPPEEAGVYEKTLSAHGIESVYLIAPTTPPGRISLIARHSKGFIYYVSRMGVTGERKRLEFDLWKRVRAIKRISNKPVAVGFGISKPDHVRAVASHADAVVVGSGIVREIETHGNKMDLVKRVGKKVKQLSAPLRVSHAHEGGHP